MTFKTKSPSTRSAPLYWFLIFAALFSLQVLPRLTQDAVVGDENLDIVDGYYYWMGDVLSTSEHPPLSKALQGLPLWTMGLKSKSGLDFSNYLVRDAYFLTVLNKDHLGTIIKSARFVTYLFGLALGLVLFGWARRESTTFVLTVLTLWAFEPALLAFSGFALSELPLTFFFFTALPQFQKIIQKPAKPSRNQAILVGLLSAMAVTVKFTALLLIPVFLILEFFAWIETKPRPILRAMAQRWLWGIGAALGGVCLVYLPGTIGIPGHFSPLKYFWNGFHGVSRAFGASYYFRGVLSQQTHWDYYPTAFLLKSPLPFLILLSLGLFLALWKKIKWPAWQWVPPLVFFAAFLFNHDMGLRLILPIYPFCILMAGRAGEWLTARSQDQRILPIVWAGLLLFQVLSVGLCFPAQVSYFNELVSPNQRLYWLGDSNLDFGQDTKRLALAANVRGWDHVKLSYFGAMDPKVYGMNWAYWTQKDLKGPQPGWVYVINDAYIQLSPAFSTTAPDILKSWILKTPPTGQIADTWYYFEIPGKIQTDKSPKILSAPIFVDDPKAFQEK